VAVVADVEDESSLLIGGAITASGIPIIPRTAGTKTQRTLRLPVANALTMSKLKQMSRRRNAGIVVKQVIW
jgi:hypothetical protein